MSGGKIITRVAKLNFLMGFVLVPKDVFFVFFLKKNLNWSESLHPLFPLSCSSLLECCNSGPNPSWVFQFPALSQTPREGRKDREENDERRGEETLGGRKGRHCEVGPCRLWLLSALAAAAPVQTLLPSPRALVTSPGHQACPAQAILHPAVHTTLLWT